MYLQYQLSYLVSIASSETVHSGYFEPKLCKKNIDQFSRLPKCFSAFQFGNIALLLESLKVVPIFFAHFSFKMMHLALQRMYFHVELSYLVFKYLSFGIHIPKRFMHFKLLVFPRDFMTTYGISKIYKICIFLQQKITR